MGALIKKIKFAPSEIRLTDSESGEISLLATTGVSKTPSKH
jgi:hypothetical protein